MQFSVDPLSADHHSHAEASCVNAPLRLPSPQPSPQRLPLGPSSWLNDGGPSGQQGWPVDGFFPSLAFNDGFDILPNQLVPLSAPPIFSPVDDPSGPAVPSTLPLFSIPSCDETIRPLDSSSVEQPLTSTPTQPISNRHTSSPLASSTSSSSTTTPSETLLPLSAPVSQRPRAHNLTVEQKKANKARVAARNVIYLEAIEKATSNFVAELEDVAPEHNVAPAKMVRDAYSLPTKKKRRGANAYNAWLHLMSLTPDQSKSALFFLPSLHDRTVPLEERHNSRSAHDCAPVHCSFNHCPKQNAKNGISSLMTNATVC